MDTHVVCWRRILGAMLVLTLASCGGSSKKPCFPVQGQVFAGQGKNRVPATGAIIIFAAKGSAKNADPCPNARVGADGTFVVSTYGNGDGAPAGDYAITIHWPAHGPPRPYKGKIPMDKRKAPHGDLEKSRISYAVETRQDNVVPLIELP